MYRMECGQLVLLSIASILASEVTHAEEQLFAYRDSSGRFTDSSELNLQEMHHIASIEETITVWVNFDISFQGNPELRTPDVVAREKRDLKLAIRSVIEPLEDSGDAHQLPVPGEAPQVPGCMVEITAAGLIALTQNELVKHLALKPKD